MVEGESHPTGSTHEEEGSEYAAEVVNLSQSSVSQVQAEMVRMSQSLADQVTATEVSVHQGIISCIKAESVNLSMAGSILAEPATFVQSEGGVGLVRRQGAMLKSRHARIV